jgi:hypothetical protein
MRPRRLLAPGILFLAAAQTARAAVFAQYVPGSYTQGTIYLDTSGDIDTYDMSFNDPTVIGDPTASPTAGLTDLDYGYPEIISPFDPPADADQLVTIGSGGSITLQFPQPIHVAASTPIVGVFTGIGFFDSQYPNGVNYSPAQTFDTQSAVVSVSCNGTNWVSLGLQNFTVPENYYANASNPYQFPAPSPAQLADFGQPYTGPANAFDGANFSQILSTLNGSAGGTWLNLAGSGLSQINYIQFSEPVGEVPVTSFVALDAISASGLPANGNVTIGSAGATQNTYLAPGVGATTLSALTINTGSTLDLTTNPLTINYAGGPDPIATIQSYLADGQILSSVVNELNSSQSSLIYAIGYADGADALVSGLSSGQIEIMPTLAGDAKLQGNVVFGDFQLLSQYFGQSGGWDEGNFTYGSVIDFADFQLLAQNFGAGDGGITTSELASLNGFAARFGDELAANPNGSGFSLVSVPEPAAATGLLMLAGLVLGRFRKFTAAILIASAIFGAARSASADYVKAIEFSGGEALDIQGVYGSGADSAYLAIDFDNPASPGGDYAWQFNWNPGTPVDGWQMLEAIAGNSIISTSPATSTSDVPNPDGDPDLTVTATYYPAFAEHLIEGLQYGPTTGTANSWDFYTGTYSDAAVSSANPQGTSWISPGVGIDEEDLTDGELIGFVNVARHAPTPTLPETSVPAPATAGASALGTLIVLKYVLRRRAKQS